MTEYGWILPAVWLGICIGAAMALSTWIVRDKHKTNRIKEMVMKDDSWCIENCEKWAYCHSRHKDPDDAWKELEEYCYDCPLALAIEDWEEKERLKKKCSGLS